MPETNTFICAKCRAEHHQPSTQRPSDWGLCEDDIGFLCADCTELAAQQDAPSIRHPLTPAHGRSTSNPPRNGEGDRAAVEGPVTPQNRTCENCSACDHSEELRNGLCYCPESPCFGLEVLSYWSCPSFAPSRLPWNQNPEPITPAQPEISIGAARRADGWSLALMIGPDQVHIMPVMQWLDLVADGTRMIEHLHRNWTAPSGSNPFVSSAVETPTATAQAA